MTVDAVLIAGPTASGKSAVALALAERLDGVVINCDSMQVYAELRVLTARPSAEQEARVPHRLYGHVPARERYSAGRYQDDAARALAEAQAAKRVPIFVGGTGLYFGVLTQGLSPIPPVSAEVRARNRIRLEAEGSNALFEELVRRDPETATRMQPADTQRVLRALDVLDASGRPLSAWQRESGKPVLAGLKLDRVVLWPSREVLYERIDRRFEAMIAAGALEEARALLGLDPALPAARALGLRPLKRHLAGEISLAEAISEGNRQSRNYAKRQMTWLRRRMADWNWIEDSVAPDSLADMFR